MPHSIWESCFEGSVKQFVSLEKHLFLVIIRHIIADNNLNRVANVYSLLKDSFKDILQELMAAELDASLSYEKNQKGDIPTSNKRNGHSPKTVKSQYGEFQIDAP